MLLEPRAEDAEGGRSADCAASPGAQILLELRAGDAEGGRSTGRDGGGTVPGFHVLLEPRTGYAERASPTPGHDDGRSFSLVPPVLHEPRARDADGVLLEGRTGIALGASTTGRNAGRSFGFELIIIGGGFGFELIGGGRNFSFGLLIIGDDGRCWESLLPELLSLPMFWSHSPELSPPLPPPSSLRRRAS